MTNPIIRHRVEPANVPLQPLNVQPVPKGLSGIGNSIAEGNTERTPSQCLRNFAQKIYGCLVNALKRIFCCSPRPPNLAVSQDEIAKILAGFNNAAVNGQINGIYITTNETNLAATRQMLERHPRLAQETIHIGCATWHNLDIICTRRSTYGLIIDFNPRNAQFLRKTVELINSCESRDAFKTAMIHYLNSLRGTERNLFFHVDQRGLPTDRIERELVREGSWLQSEESYLYLKREVVSIGRLIAITEDIKNFENFSKIRQFLDSKKIAIDTLYMSNICNFVNTPHERTAFVKSIRHLLDRNSIFINCPKIKQPNIAEIILDQRAVLGDEILADAYDVSKLFEEVHV